MRNTDMDCTEAEAHLPLFVGGDLEAPLTQKVEAHLISCASCGGRLSAAEDARLALLSLVELDAGDDEVDLWPGVRAGLADAGLVGSSAPSPTLGRVLSFARYFGGAAAAAVLAMLIWRPWAGDLTPSALSGPSESELAQPGGLATAALGASDAFNPQPANGGLELGRSLELAREVPSSRPSSRPGVTYPMMHGATPQLVSHGGIPRAPVHHTHSYGNINLNQIRLVRIGAPRPGAQVDVGPGLRRVTAGDPLLRDSARIYPEGPKLILPGRSSSPAGGDEDWSLASDGELR